MRKLIHIFLLCLIAKTALAEEPVVLECSKDDGSWWATIEMYPKKGMLTFDNTYDRFLRDNWNNFQKEYAAKNNKEFVSKEYTPPDFVITKTTTSEVTAAYAMFGSEVTGTLKRQISINRFTLSLRDPHGEYKCKKMKKEF